MLELLPKQKVTEFLNNPTIKSSFKIPLISLGELSKESLVEVICDAKKEADSNKNENPFGFGPEDREALEAELFGLDEKNHEVWDNFDCATLWTPFSAHGKAEFFSNFFSHDFLSPKQRLERSKSREILAVKSICFPLLLKKLEEMRSFNSLKRKRKSWQ